MSEQREWPWCAGLGAAEPDDAITPEKLRELPGCCDNSYGTLTVYGHNADGVYLDYHIKSNSWSIRVKDATDEAYVSIPTPASITALRELMRGLGIVTE